MQHNTYKYLSLDSLKGLELIDVDLASIMMNIFLSECPVQIQNIEDLITTKNCPEFGKRIHALKGSISVFGCVELCTELKNIELLAKELKFDESVESYNNIKNQIEEFKNEIQLFIATANQSSAA